MPDRQADQHPPQFCIFSFLEVFEQLTPVSVELAFVHKGGVFGPSRPNLVLIARTAFCISQGALQGLLIKIEQPRFVRKDSGLNQVARTLLPQGFDVESAAARQVGQACGQLCWAGTAIGATPVFVIFFLRGQGSATRRTSGGENEGRFTAVTKLNNWAQNFGNNLARFAQHDRVSDEYAFALNLILVVQSGHLYGGAGDIHRFHDGKGRDAAGSAHTTLDINELGGYFLRWIFVSDGPTRRAGGSP